MCLWVGSLTLGLSFFPLPTQTTPSLSEPLPAAVSSFLGLLRGADIGCPEFVWSLSDGDRMLNWGPPLHSPCTGHRQDLEFETGSQLWLGCLPFSYAPPPLPCLAQPPGAQVSRVSVISTWRGEEEGASGSREKTWDSPHPPPTPTPSCQVSEVLAAQAGQTIPHFLPDIAEVTDLRG